MPLQPSSNPVSLPESNKTTQFQTPNEDLPLPPTVRPVPTDVSGGGKERQRKNVIEEILVSERDYVNDLEVTLKVSVCP